MSGDATRRKRRQLDPFVVAIGDAAPRDQRDLMERPFFSLAKAKRIAPILYEAGGQRVEVHAMPEHGMATIWDADVLIWAASQIVEAANHGLRTSRFLRFTPYQMLVAIDRTTGAREYRLLKGALARLQSMVIRTTIVISGIDPNQQAPDMPDAADDARPLTGEPVAPMRLRPEPPRVTRLSRKALAVLASVAGVGLGSALIYALQVQQGGKPAEEVYATDGRSTPDGLNALPKDYTGPVLGPPLPGDLGRPILDAQNRSQPVPVPGIDAPAGPAAPDPEIERRRQELEQRRQELEAARTSRVFFQSGAQTPAASGGTSGEGVSNLAGMGAPGQTATPTAQDRQLAFLNQAADRRTVAPDRVTAPPSPYVVQAGAVIPAALITGIRSDLPGQVTAQVTENVYDSPTGRLLLIPQGTRLIGQYDSGVGFGQRRVLLTWTRLIFPNGRSIVLERQPGADAQGYAGPEDGVDHHWWDLAKAAGLSTLLSIGAQAGSSGEQGDLVRALRQGASDGISQTDRQVVGRQLDIAPTLTIRPGFPVRVIVGRDLVFR